MTATQTAAAAIAGASAVIALVGSRYWPDRASVDSPALPYITFQVITELRDDFLAGPGQGKRCRIQFNCYGKTRAAADALADALEAALKLTGWIKFRQGTYDFEAQAYWAQIDWSVAIASP